MLKIHLRRIPGSFNTEIWVLGIPEGIGPGSVLSILTPDKDGNVIAKSKPHIPGEDVLAGEKPTMILPEPELRELIQAFQEIAKNEGVPDPGESFSKGKLEAEGRHLEDLRTLLKLNAKTNNKSGT